MKIEYSKESFESFIFVQNWIEPPLLFNNEGKVLRFDLVSKPERESYQRINQVFDDLFVEDSYVYVIFYGSKDISWRAGKKYFKMFSLKKILKKAYLSRDNEMNDENPYLVVCETKTTNFKKKKYFSDYLRGEQKACMVFISRKKSSALHFYDNRGFDFLSDDEDFLNLINNRYSDYLIK